MNNKCEKCFTKSLELKIFHSKLIECKNGNFCDPCFKQSMDKEQQMIKELQSRGLDLSLYCKKETTVPTAIPLQLPNQTPTPTIINNFITNNITNNITKNKHIHFDKIQDFQDEKDEKQYHQMVKEEEQRIQKMKEWRNKKLWYDKCSRCKKNKHYSDFNEVLDKDGKNIIINKIAGVENPLTEEGTPMVRRTAVCSDCLIQKREQKEEHKVLTQSLKTDNTYVCKCGGSWFMGHSDNISEFNKLRHERTKKHQEYEEKLKLQQGSNIQLDKLNRNMLRDICKLNGITGYNNMTKQQTLDAIKSKEIDLQKKNQVLILS